MFWERKSRSEINERVFGALDNNLNYRDTTVMGVPASYLDKDEFYHDAPFLKTAPFLTAMVANPNHIGCHTNSVGEEYFAGTHEIERELLALCAEQILRCDEGEFDGYVASGGTEANIQACWIYRNLFMAENNATLKQIAIVCSTDSHYSMQKAANLLGIEALLIDVNPDTRELLLDDLEEKLTGFIANGGCNVIFVANMCTTMFGSVDKLAPVIDVFQQKGLQFKVHVDGAFGGFIYPFLAPDNELDFQNKHVSSVTLDAHKMLQSPYGTGIFLARKGLMDHVFTDAAKYVKGADSTLCGSRSGANAISVWMILQHRGSSGWTNKLKDQIDKTERLASCLDELGIRYFRNEHVNILTIRSEDLPEDIAQKYHLVPDVHSGKVSWWKIVVMPHVTQGMVDSFCNELKAK